MKVIYLKFELNSFSYQNGLYAIQKEKDGILYLCKLKSDGTLSRYEDGTPSIFCIGVNNNGIFKTDLIAVE